MTSTATAAAPEVKKTKDKNAESGDEGSDSFTQVGKGGKSMQFTAEGIFKNLQLVQEARGKKASSLYPHLLSADDYPEH